MYSDDEGEDAWWDFDRQEAQAIEISNSFPNKLSFTPDGRLATMRLWGGIALFDVPRRMPIAVCNFNDFGSGALSPDGRMIATINSSGVIAIIDTSLNQGIPAGADQVAIQPDNRRLVAASSGKVTVYSIGKLEPTIVRNSVDDRLNVSRIESLSQNGLRYAFTDNHKQKIRLLDVSSSPASEVPIEGNYSDVL
ncbi:MAG: WD40 repeat domain-containing protein [Pseudonocardiales bacterium]|nr:WD40 repeat domain-containing protein [Pseudonocardiales bacterium]